MKVGRLFNPFFVVVLLGVQFAFAQKVQRPNVIVILTDDQGYGDFSCNGNPILMTPAIDRLYSESIRFSDFHVAPLCTPSRGQLMSGLDALRNRAATVGTGRDMMRRDIIAMPEVFKDNGYRTGIFGKWHLGDNYPDRPMDRGFEKCIWFKGWGLLSEAEYDNDYYQTRYLDSLKTIQSNKYCTDLWFDEAMNWMDKMNNEHQLFFVYLPTNSPHGPFYALKDDYEFYKTKVKDSSTAEFFGMIKNIDKNLGRLDRWLEERHLKNNTLIVLMNDNGGTGGVNIYNAGMRGKKGDNYDGGHRAACFIRWPKGNLGSPRTVAYTSEIQDILPTFIDLLHLKVPRSAHFDGKSLKQVLLDPKVKYESDRMVVVQYGGSVMPQKYYSCVLWNSWRLVGKDELYDISKDPGQQNNIAAQYPQILKKLSAYYERWWENVEADVNGYVPILVGSDKENPVTLTSDFWADSAYVNTQWHVAQAAGERDGGIWHLDVQRKGTYEISLSRWPFHLNRKMGLAGPAYAVGGTKIREGKALAIASGSLSVNNQEPTVHDAQPDADKVYFKVQLDKGPTTLRAWLNDAKGTPLCGAYYVKIFLLKK
jgi:arylsulfatase A-like enzyme